MPIENFNLTNTFEWIDITNPTKEELESISKSHHLHHYTLMDSLEPDHLPKYEELNDTHFFITRILLADNENGQTIQELSTKIAVFYNDHLLITIHRLPQPSLAEIVEKYVKPGRIKKTAEVVTKIIWYVLHSYDEPAIKLSEQIDFYESKIFLPHFLPNMLEGIYYLKRKASLCKKLLLLTNEVISSIRTTTEDSAALQDVRDLHLKLVTLYDQVTEDAHNLVNIYISLSGQKTNEVMKILTIFSVFFMPLTFIAGIYGMNFEFMPELKHKYGYPITMAVMAAIVIVIYTWFKRKRWL